MKTLKCGLTQEQIKEFLTYDPVEGTFTRNVPAKGGRYAGTLEIKGSDNGYGYLRVWLYGKSHCLHILAWIYVTGREPEGFIDHKDRDRANNRFSNFRECSRSENNCNRGLRKDSVSGVPGVGKENGKYRVRLQLNKKRVFLGYYDDLELAELVAEEAREKYHGEFANARQNRP